MVHFVSHTQDHVYTRDALPGSCQQCTTACAKCELALVARLASPGDMQSQMLTCVTVIDVR